MVRDAARSEELQDSKIVEQTLQDLANTLIPSLWTNLAIISTQEYLQITLKVLKELQDYQ